MSAKVIKTNPSSRQLVQRQQYRILDESARNRRNRSQLEQLERDNFHDDPHANLVMHKKAPKFEDNNKALNNGSGSSLKRHQLPRSRMLTLSSLIEEDSKTDEPNYSSAVTRSPINSSDNKTPFIPKRKFCSVCGFASNYNCVSCGFHYCSLNCLKIHSDTRCLKWTA
jgi:zinc finger HIT domain-containing protein 1